MLYGILTSCTKGAEVKSFIRNPKSSGFVAWKQLTRHYDPRTGADRTVAYGRITNNVTDVFGQAKTLDQARTLFQKWENEVHAFELRFAKHIDEDAKMLAAKSLMPMTMFGQTGAFRGRSFKDFQEVKMSSWTILKTEQLKPRRECHPLIWVKWMTWSTR